MKAAILLACCLGCAVARPQGAADSGASAGGAPEIGASVVTPIPILIDERVPIDPFGGFGMRFQTGNGISWAENAVAAGPLNQVTRTGQYTFTHPDGTPHLLTYTAGINGFQPISDLIPTPHPLEPWHIEQIEFAARQKAAEAAAAAESQVSA
ncbi:cuticle protein AMP1A-like [Macrobrachium rosenbergii]|uniref:cuticle protein AMP1A-like n=1 Tax=Macrobrachium rosenbergii TaxID=79674 RepID=UPI0034D4CDAF